MPEERQTLVGLFDVAGQRLLSLKLDCIGAHPEIGLNVSGEFVEDLPAMAEELIALKASQGENLDQETAFQILLAKKLEGLGIDPDTGLITIKPDLFRTLLKAAREEVVLPPGTVVDDDVVREGLLIAVERFRREVVLEGDVPMPGSVQ